MTPSRVTFYDGAIFEVIMKKTLRPFATKLTEETLSRLDALAQKTRIPKSRLLEQAIGLLSEHYRQIDSDLVLAQKIREGDRLQPV